jgi:hypothetical protein
MLETLRQQIGHPPENNSLRTPELFLHLRQARQQPRDYQGKHIELREDHLTSLAEARILEKQPSLLSNPDRFQRATKDEIR